MMRKICLLGASGSIGRQSLDIIEKYPSRFVLTSFSVGKQSRKIPQIIKKHPQIRAIYLINEEEAKRYQRRYPGIVFYYGDKGLNQLVKKEKYDMLVNALVGYIGLSPTVYALKRNKIVALANKESLVIGGELINDLLSQGKGKIYPIDSEHAAISKCLSIDDKNVKRIILTASGGAFRDYPLNKLDNVTAADALKHPTWKMGAKITIDCATMVNKAFEIIEAHYLFNYPKEKIDILMHDESYIHSLVEYEDGFYRLDIGKPDMHVPIKYALFEGQIEYDTVYLDDYHKIKNTHFRTFDPNRYKSVKYAYEVIDKKGISGAVFNAANEEAVYEFLKGNISFRKIEEIIDYFMNNYENINNPSLSALLKVDKEIRRKVHEYINQGH